MKVYGSFNKVSDKVKARIPKLKKGQVVEYESLKKRPDPLRPGFYRYPAAQQIATMFQIFDEGAGEFVDVGLVRGKDAAGNIIPDDGRFIEASGRVILIGGNLRDEALYEIMELSHQNLSNPFRDESVAPIFQRVDKVRDAEKEEFALDTQLEAMNYVASLDEAEARQLYAALGKNEEEDVKVIRADLKKMARDKSQTMLDFVNDPLMKNKALVKIAETHRIVKFDNATNRMLWYASDEPIATLGKQDGKTYYDSMAEWFQTHPDGNKELSRINEAVEKVFKAQPAKKQKDEKPKDDK